MDAGETDVEPSLTGRVVAVPETRQLDVLAGLLERRGATVLRCPLVGIRDTPNDRAVLAWLGRRLEPTAADLLVFYTGEGVERLIGFARRAGLESRLIAALRQTDKLTRGPKPKRALRRFGLEPQIEASTPTTEGLIAALEGIDLEGRRVAVQLYNPDDRPALIDYLRRRGIEPDCVAPYVYASASETGRVVDFIDRLHDGAIDAIAFTSKAQLERLLAVARENGREQALRRGLERTSIAAVGPVVAAELESMNLRVAAMPEQNFSMKPLVTSLCSLLGATKA